MTILVETLTQSVELRVPENTDLDDRFIGVCVDTGERITVNGWQCYIEIIDEN